MVQCEAFACKLWKSNHQNSDGFDVPQVPYFIGYSAHFLHKNYDEIMPADYTWDATTKFCLHKAILYANAIYYNKTNR